MPDDTLADLDWVVASLHTSFDNSPTERMLAAIDNPHVDLIGHLTGRRLSRAPGADVDVERIVERAVATGTVLEINSQPDRLDLRDTHARVAGEAGVLVPVTTDAHSIGALCYAELGIGQARRAWLTREQVLNTRPWARSRGCGGEPFREDGYAAVDWVADTWRGCASTPCSRASSRVRSGQRFRLRHPRRRSRSPACCGISTRC